MKWKWKWNELDLFNFETEKYLKNAIGVDTSKIVKKIDLANSKYHLINLDIDKLKNVPSGLSYLRTKVAKLNMGKLETTPVYLGKLSNVIKNDVVKKTEYDARLKNIGHKISDIRNLATKTTHNAKINEAKA